MKLKDYINVDFFRIIAFIPILFVSFSMTLGKVIMPQFFPWAFTETGKFSIGILCLVSIIYLIVLHFMDE